MMGAQYAKNKELLERDGATQSGESFIYEQARLIAYSHLDDEDEDFSAREMDDLLAREDKDPIGRVALKLICADQLRKGPLLPSLQEWISKYLERDSGFGRGEVLELLEILFGVHPRCLRPLSDQLTVTPKWTRYCYPGY